MFISEIFHSLQGEGLLIGVPSIFIRTSGCNLRCRWCDTPYASWKPEGEHLSIDAIMNRVDRLLSKLVSVDEVQDGSGAQNRSLYGNTRGFSDDEATKQFAAEVEFRMKSHGYASCRHIVLTGGEPMMAPELPELAALLRREGYHITIETAATVTPNGIDCDLASLSPKLAHSTPDSFTTETWKERHEKTRYQPEVIRAWLQHSEFQLKFVVSSQDDLAEIEALLQEVGPVPRDRILLMPEGTHVDILRERAPHLAKLCLERGFRFAPRLQIELYGNTRGT